MRPILENFLLPTISLEKIENLYYRIVNYFQFRFFTYHLGSGDKTHSVITPSKKYHKDLVVSLTTYKDRIFNVHLTIESIGFQSVKPNRLILWIDENEFKEKDLTPQLNQLTSRGLEIRFCPNYRSYKKLIPTLEICPDANIVTIDDDMIYPNDMLERFLSDHHLFPDCVLCNRAHLIRLDSKGELLPYRKWDINTNYCRPTKFIFPVGIGGIFYPEGCLHHEVNNIEAFSNMAPYADDVWFKAMSMLNNCKSKKVNYPGEFRKSFVMIPCTQDGSLNKENFDNDRNDVQISDVFSRYNIKLIG